MAILLSPEGIIFIAVTAAIVLFRAGIAIKQALCKHDKGVHESRSCDAICKKCGKNLGFIFDFQKSISINENTNNAPEI